MAEEKSRQIVIRPQADQDITEHTRYIARDNVEAGLRFYEATEETFQALVQISPISIFKKLLSGVQHSLERRP